LDDNEFGDEVAAIDQGNTADQDAAQEQDANQEDNYINTQFGFSQQTEDFECPPGFIINDNGQCEQPVTQDPTSECPEGFDFDPATDQRERTITQAPECPEGYTFNPETDLCEQRQTQPPT
jgi:hypothetical protein